jgi:hypothetical protein
VAFGARVSPIAAVQPGRSRAAPRPANEEPESMIETEHDDS